MVMRRPVLMSSFQSLARICLCLKVRNVPGSCCMLYFLTAFFPVGRCFVLAAFIIPQIVTPFLLVLGAMPPRGHAFPFCFSFLFRSLSFLFFASCLHLDNPAFRFDSRHCRTFRINPNRIPIYFPSGFWYHFAALGQTRRVTDGEMQCRKRLSARQGGCSNITG